MRLVKPKYQILQCPDGEAALALLEEIGRIAYKSEDQIVKGEWCRGCDGTGIAKVEPTMADEPWCPVCRGRKWTTEPSSHRFVRMILKAERQAKMIVLARQLVDNATIEPEFPYLEECRTDLAKKLVWSIVEYMEQNPAHESVIEHCVVTVKFTSNRGFTHELVRHRLAAFTQESTRYCNYSKGKFGSEISVAATREFDDDVRMVWESTHRNIERSYMKLTEAGVKPQIARDVLPQSTKADIACTANFREWRHIFRMRCSPAAHPDMRELMIPLREDLRARVPIIFD